MKLLRHSYSSSYTFPVAVGDLVVDRTCFICEPKIVEVLELHDEYLRVRDPDGDPIESQKLCERWEHVQTMREAKR